MNLKTVSDLVDPRDFVVELDELYKIPSWSTSLALTHEKLFEK